MPDYPFIVTAAEATLYQELYKLFAITQAITDFGSALAQTDPTRAFGGNPVSAAVTIQTVTTAIGTPPGTADTPDYANASDVFTQPIANSLDPLYGASNPNFMNFSQATQHGSTIYKYLRAQLYFRQELWFLRDQNMLFLRDTNDWLLIKQVLTLLQDMKRINLPRERANQVTALAQQVQSYFGASNVQRAGMLANEWLENIQKVTYITRWMLQCSNDPNGLVLSMGQLEDAMDAWRTYVVAPIPTLLCATPASGEQWSSSCPSCL